MPNTDDTTIAALLHEREGYARYGKEDRVAEVDAELARLGHKPSPTTQPEPEAEPQSAALPPKAEPETASLEAPETATVPRGRPRRSAP